MSSIKPTSTTAIVFDGKELVIISDDYCLKGKARRCEIREITDISNDWIAVASYGTPRIAAAVEEWIWTSMLHRDRDLPTYDAAAEAYMGVVVSSEGAFTILPEAKNLHHSARGSLVAGLKISSPLAGPAIWGFVPEVHADPLPVGLNAMTLVKSIYACLPDYEGTIVHSNSVMWPGFPGFPEEIRSGPDATTP
jgi:hypothetical protein